MSHLQTGEVGMQVEEEGLGDVDLHFGTLINLVRVHVLAHPYVVGTTAFHRGEGLPATSEVERGLDMVGGGQGQGVTLCGQVVLVPGRFRVLGHVQDHTRRIRDIAGVGVGPGQAVPEGGVEVVMISETAGRGRPFLKTRKTHRDVIYSEINLVLFLKTSCSASYVVVSQYCYYIIHMYPNRCLPTHHQQGKERIRNRS